MSVTFRAVNGVIKVLTDIFLRIDDHELVNVPLQGPLIVIANHVNFLEVPIVYIHLMPRPVTGLVKIETWDSFSLGWIFRLWGGIPIHRGEADLEAMRLSLEALKQDKILGLSPEGTRSNDGKLQKAHGGVVVLALKSGVPILPIVTFGGEYFHHNWKRLRRTDFFIKVGRQFYLDDHGERVTKEIRQAMTDEMMYQMALLLPPQNRGVYSNIECATTNYIRWA